MDCKSFDRNQEEPSVYKVLLLWGQIAVKLFLNYVTTSEVQQAKKTY